MNWSATIRTLLLCSVLVFLHYTLRPLLAWRASPDFLIIALLLAAVRVRPGVAAMPRRRMSFGWKLTPRASPARAAAP